MSLFISGISRTGLTFQWKLLSGFTEINNWCSLLHLWGHAGALSFSPSEARWIPSYINTKYLLFCYIKGIYSIKFSSSKPTYSHYHCRATVNSTLYFCWQPIVPESSCQCQVIIKSRQAKTIRQIVSLKTFVSCV